MDGTSYTVKFTDGKTFEVPIWSFGKQDRGLGLLGEYQLARQKGEAIRARLIQSELIQLTIDTDVEGVEKIVKADMSNYEILFRAIYLNETERMAKIWEDVSKANDIPPVESGSDA